MAAKQKVTVDITTGVGTLSFPRLFPDTAEKNDKGEVVYECQIIIPKTQKKELKAILSAIKTVGEAQFGDSWRKVRNPLRDGDKEADELTEDGSTKGDKYPERLGCYFLNARSKRPVLVVDRDRDVVHDSSVVYGGSKGRLSIQFYPYSTAGNHGVGASLNGVQKVAEGEPFGAGPKSVESMFDVLDDEDDLDLDDVDVDEEDEEEEAPAPKKRVAKKAAKKAPAKRKKPEPEPEDLDEDDLDDDDDLDIDDDL